MMNGVIVSEDDILNALKDRKEETSSADLKWRFFHYCRDNNLKNIGNGQYVRKEMIYDYALGQKAENINQYLTSQFPEIKTAVWESRILNEWLNLLIAKNTIFVETEKPFLETVFDSLTDFQGDALILVNPDIEEYYRYQREGLIVLRTLVARSPVTEDNHITIEKLFVDLLCDKLLTGLFDRNTVVELIKSATRTYAVNEKKLFAYARRRGRYDEIVEYWSSLND